MCGIAGFSGDFPGELLDQFSATLRHRGPDDHGVYQDRGVGLAHTRLSILDLSPRGHQPMIHGETGCAITYNGEIYNYRALRNQLIAQGHTFQSECDTEVLLHLYLAHGADMLGMLDGIFAFAIWDPRDRSLLIARDQLGVKPLYVATPPQGVLFASELKALLCSPTVSRELDPHAIDATIRHLWCPAPRTILKSVRKVEPGCALLVRDGKVVRTWRYFDLPVQAPVRASASAEAMREELDRAVRDQLIADVPVGAFLSGGLDSTAIVALARRHVDKLPCFTMRFSSGATASEGFDDDLPYARRVAKALGVELVEISVGGEVASELEEMIYQLDEPQADIAPLNVRRIAEAARAHGIKVLLSGAGGDDLFAGYRRHQAGQLERYWSWLPVPARRMLRVASGALPQHSALGRRVAKLFRDADRDRDRRLVGYFDWLDGAHRAQLFTPSVAAELSASAYEPLLTSVRALPDDVDALNRLLYLDGRYFLPDHNLNYTDKMAMAHGVEVRVPLLAVELARFASRLPSEDKLRGRTGKWILREAMRGVVPDEVLTRSKTGFGAPLRVWLHNELRPLVEDVLSAGALRRRGIFDPTAVASLIAADRSGKIDAAYPILAILAVELWCRAFLDANHVVGSRVSNA